MVTPAGSSRMRSLRSRPTNDAWISGLPAGASCPASRVTARAMARPQSWGSLLVASASAE